MHKQFKGHDRLVNALLGQTSTEHMRLDAPVFMLLGMVQPLPQCMHKVKINLATGTRMIQGKVPSVNAEATYRVWLAKILLLGEELHQDIDHQ
jgi:hypothetical protein